MVRILVVDDEARIRSSLKRLLESQSGYEVLEARGLDDFYNIIERIEYGDDKPLDLIILDHQLDPCYGWDLLEVVRKSFGENCCRYNFVVCTGNPNPQLNEQYRRLGALSHIVKPYENSITQFWNTIEAALIDERSQLHRGSKSWERLSSEEQRTLREKEFDSCRELADYGRLFRTASQWITYFIEQNKYDDVFLVDDELTLYLGRQYIVSHNNFYDAFDVYESLIPYPQFHELISNRFLYFASCAITEYSANKPISGIIRGIRLFYREYYPEYDTDLRFQIEKRKQDIKIINDEFPGENEPEITDFEFDEDIYVGLAGGRKPVCDGIVGAFNSYSKIKFSRIPPSSESALNEGLIRDKFRKCALIIMIIGYMGHDLSRAVMSLKRRSAITGDILIASSQGMTGIVREIEQALLNIP